MRKAHTSRKDCVIVDLSGSIKVVLKDDKRKMAIIETTDGRRVTTSYEWLTDYLREDDHSRFTKVPCSFPVTESSAT